MCFAPHTSRLSLPPFKQITRELTLKVTEGQIQCNEHYTDQV